MTISTVSQYGGSLAAMHVKNGVPCENKCIHLIHLNNILEKMGVFQPESEGWFGSCFWTLSKKICALLSGRL